MHILCHLVAHHRGFAGMQEKMLWNLKLLFCAAKLLLYTSVLETWAVFVSGGLSIAL